MFVRVRVCGVNRINTLGIPRVDSGKTIVPSGSSVVGSVVGPFRSPSESLPSRFVLPSLSLEITQGPLYMTRSIKYTQ